MVQRYEVKAAVDLTLLDMKATEDKFVEFVEYAVKGDFKRICIPSSRVEMVRPMIRKNESLKICATIGFPFGHNTRDSKIMEIQEAAKHGAVEVDIVPDFLQYLEKRELVFEQELTDMIKVCKDLGLISKVIIETCEWEFYDIIKLTKIVKKSGADFVKTSSGKSKEGAKLEDVGKMSNYMPTKASGGIRSYDDAANFMEVGAKRLGIGYESAVKIFGSPPNFAFL